MKKLQAIIAGVILGGLMLTFSAGALVQAANDAQNVFNNTQVSNPTDIELTGMAAPGDVKGFLLSLVRIAKNIISVIAVLAIVIVGVRMISTVEGDEEIARQRKILLGIVSGLIVINIAEPYVYTIYQENGTLAGGSDEMFSRVAAMKFQRDLVEPVINFAVSFLAGIAVFMLVVSGFRIITAAGDEQALKKQQFVIIQSIIGLFLVLIAQPLVKAVYGYKSFNVFDREFASPDLGFGIRILVQVMNYILSFFFLGALAMLIYAGFLMVAHFGQEEFIEKGKKIVRYTIISIIIAISSYTLVAWLVTLTP